MTDHLIKTKTMTRQQWLWPKEKVNGYVMAVLYNFSSDDTSPFYISFHLLQQIRCRNVYWQWEVEQSQGLFWPPLEFVRTRNTEPHTEHTFRVCKNTCIVRRKTETWHPGLMELYTDTIQGFDQSKPFLLPNAMEEKPYKSSLSSSGYTNCTSWNLNWKGKF